jgi:hypothetical protein
MPGGMGMAASVTQRRRIAAADVPAGLAQSQVNPRTAETQAFLAAIGRAGRYRADEAQVGIGHR